MKVRATQTGFIYGIKRFPGSIIELQDKAHFSHKWMEEVSDETPVVVTEPAPKSYHNALQDTPIAAVNKPPMAIAELERLAVANTAPPPQEVAPAPAPAPVQETGQVETPPSNELPSGDRKVL